MPRRRVTVRFCPSSASNDCSLEIKGKQYLPQATYLRKWRPDLREVQLTANSLNAASPTPSVRLKHPASLLDKLLNRLDKSSDSVRWKTHRAASRGLNDPTAAARRLKVAPGRVNRLIRAGAVHLYPLDERYHYVRVKEVRQALEQEADTVQKV